MGVFISWAKLPINLSCRSIASFKSCTLCSTCSAIASKSEEREPTSSFVKISDRKDRFPDAISFDALDNTERGRVSIYDML